METLCTAVGRYRLEKDKNGGKYPVIFHAGKEQLVTLEEFVLWSAALFRFYSTEQLEKLYYRKLYQLEQYPEKTFEDVYRRLKIRNLIVQGEGDNDAEALYNLTNNLHIIPAQPTLLEKIYSFFKFWLVHNIPLRRSFRIFHRNKLSEEEKAVWKLCTQRKISFSEVIRLRGEGISDISSFQSFVEQMPDFSGEYNTESDNNAPFTAESYTVLEAAANLYLKKRVILESPALHTAL